MVEAHFDSNIPIDYLRGIQLADLELSRYEVRYISVITWMELMAGPLEDVVRVRSMLSTNFRVVALSPDIAELGARLRREMRIKLADAIILATARVNGRILVSRNTRDFPVGTPGVRVPYQLPVSATTLPVKDGR